MVMINTMILISLQDAINCKQITLDDGSDSKFKCKRRCALCFKAGDLPSNVSQLLIFYFD